MSGVTNTLIFFLGFLTPLPLFFDIEKFQLIVLDFNYGTITTGINSGIPVPVGLFATSFFLAYSTKLSLTIFKKPLILCTLIFLAYAYYRIGLKSVPLIFPIIGFFYISGAFRNFNEIKSFAYGYTLGAASFFACYALSLVFYMPLNIDDTMASGYQLFGYEIYQFYVSVSAVTSLIFSVMLLLITVSKDTRSAVLSSCLYIITIISPIIILSAARKAAFVELCVFAVLLVVRIISDGKQLSLRKLLPLFLLAVVIVYFYFVINTNRDFTIEGAVDQRGDAYQEFLHIIPDLSLIDYFFGNRSEFGGYSNIAVDLFMSLGIVGFVCYVTLLILSLKALKQSTKLITVRAYRDTAVLQTTLQCLFLVSFIVGNTVNLNLTQPYYVVNLVGLLCVAYTVIRKVLTNRTIATDSVI
jgi:hypothetical protein